MMKFYTKPEIEALALEVVDVVETSANIAKEALSEKMSEAGGSNATVQVIEQQIAEMSTDWQW
jgi:hypothetical protein